MIAHVFGKSHGCAKCDMLKRRLHALLEKDEYRNIQYQFHDILTEEGVVDFCKAQCVNPNRVPALMLSHDNGEYIENPYHHEPNPETGMPKDPVDKTEKFKKSMTYQYVGLQTDYTDGGGILPGPMIEELLKLGLQLD